MISVSDLSFKYSATTSLAFPDFTVNSGEHFLLLGESGSGKTTLLYLLGGLLRNYSGSVEVMGVKLESLSEHALDKFRGQHIGFVFQRNHLITALTVEQNLMMPAFLAGFPASHDRIDEVLTSLGIINKRKARVTDLSQGQAQRVAIARAVINKPAIILADEPTSALDDKHCNSVISLLTDVAAQNKATLVIATHDQRLKNVIEKKIILDS